MPEFKTLKPSVAAQASVILRFESIRGESQSVNLALKSPMIRTERDANRLTQSAISFITASNWARVRLGMSIPPA